MVEVLEVRWWWRMEWMAEAESRRKDGGERMMLSEAAAESTWVGARLLAH